MGNDGRQSLVTAGETERIMAALISLRHLFCAAVFLGLLNACVTTGEQAKTANASPEPRTVTMAKAMVEPRPMSVPDNATPEERGRKILRVVVELIKRGDLRDTAFVSRLLNIPLNDERSISLRSSEQIPYQIAQRIRFFPNFEFKYQPPSIFIWTLKEQTCVSLDDLLATFHREFGVGTEIVPDVIQGKPVDIPLVRGWSRTTQIVDGPHWYLSIGRYMSNDMLVSAHGSIYEKCIPVIDLKDFRRSRQLLREKNNG